MWLHQVKQNHPCKMLREFFVFLIFVFYLTHLALSYQAAPLADVTSEIEHHAQYHTWYPKITYTGAQATVGVYSYPNLKNGEATAAIVWLSDYKRGDDVHRLNYIQAGWAVAPSVFGDSKTHFFVYWTIGSNSTGCYNLECDGFVPVNSAPLTPGDTLDPDNGQSKISFKIFKNKDDGDWWLHFGYDVNDLKPVGFWPKSLFTNLVDNAQRISWGGYVGANRGSPSPPMGNGQWAGKKSAWFLDVKFVDTSGQPYLPPIWPKPGSITDTVSNEKCYQISAYVNNRGFNYGGPGGCTD